MATIKFKRGTGQPTGLTAYEPAWDTTNNRLFINTGTTAMWIGAAVIQDTLLAGNCAWTIPTQNSVKSYVDTRVAAGSTSIQGNFLFIGGSTANAAPLNGDTADRGIVFQWNTGSAGRTGFFGFDQTTQRFTFIPSGITIANGHVTGTAGNVNLAGVYAPQGILTLAGVSNGFESSAIVLTAGATGFATSTITYSGRRHIFANGDVNLPPRIELYSDTLSGGIPNTIVASAALSEKIFTLPNITGTGVVADAAGATSGWILRATGASTAPTWINPAAAGFTAFTSGNVNILGIKDTVNYNLVFTIGTGGNQAFYSDSTSGIKWRPSTNTLTVGDGLGYFEGIVDGGGF